jgi:putative membrane protein
VLAGLVPGALYLIGVQRIRRRYGRPWSPWRTASFAAGCVLVCVALSPVVDRPAAADARGHMVQHLMLGMYAPLGLVLGAPLTLLLGASLVDARRAMRRMLGRRWVRLPANLVVATGLSVGGLYMLYLTPLYALSTRSDVVHHLTHLHFLVAGSLFAWAIAGPDPSRHGHRWHGGSSR